MPRKGDTGSSVENSPVRSKVFLQMCTESVVKDISLISDDSWTYNDLLVSTHPGKHSALVSF